MTHRLRTVACGALLVAVFGFAETHGRRAAPLATADPHDWPVYAGNAAGTRYSSLAQINTANVGRLQVAWQFDPKDAPAGRGGLQTTPLVVRGVLYTITPGGRLVALDGATGQLKWAFNSNSTGQRCRGVTYWTDGTQRRILVGFGRYVYAVDADTGQQIRPFGLDGRIDLQQGLGRDPDAYTLISTSPGVLYKDTYIVGGRLAEALPTFPGDIRAYDARSGTLRWSFHTIPHPGEYGYDTWPTDAWTYIGAANNWAGMAVDEQRGIVYVPTGSPASDFYGGNRLGDGLFANTLLALDAETGKRLWHFQAVKHDLWDRDFPSPPILITVKRNGQSIDAVAQATKQGFLFVFDRVTGTPLFPIEYRKVPPSTIPGEVAAETQPFPLKPAPFARTLLTEDMLSHRTPDVHQWALERFRTFRSEGQFVPLMVGKETVVMPGFDGGAEWGGSAFDPDTGNLYLNANDIAFTSSMRENTAKAPDPHQTIPYNFTGHNRWYDPDGYPAVAPPWGTLNAINLNTGDYSWKVPLGQYPTLVAQGLSDTGTENYGGPIVTAGGLVFIGATNFDRKFRAFDKATGQVLWEAVMPNAGNATPATYEVNGRQFVVIAAFGGKARAVGAEAAALAGAGGAFVAFAMPTK